MESQGYSTTYLQVSRFGVFIEPETLMISGRLFQLSFRLLREDPISALDRLSLRVKLSQRKRECLKTLTYNFSFRHQ